MKQNTGIAKSLFPFLFTGILIFSCGNPPAATSNADTASVAKSPEIKTTDSPKSKLPDPDTIRHLVINTIDPKFILEPHHIRLQKGIQLTLNIPRGYKIAVAAEGMHRLRFLSRSPDGRLFATDMFNTSDNQKGSVYLFNGWDSTNHRFNTIDTFLTKLRNPNQVAFYREKSIDYLYVAETGVLNRYIYHAGDMKPSGAPQTVATFPSYGLSYKYGGWHLTRSIAFHKNKLYVSVGSSCNACLEKETDRATILEMDPDGQHKKIYATGLRNSVDIKWVENNLWATGMGRDLLGADKPEDQFLLVEERLFYGWPYYYQFHQKIYPDKAMQDSAKLHGITVPAEPPVAYCGFRAHSAPLGLEFLTGFIDSSLDHSFLVALHGSTTVSRQRGNAIVKLNGPDYVDLVNGFLEGKEEKDRKGRPCDILQFDKRSFFFTDDLNGVLYYVWKEE